MEEEEEGGGWGGGWGGAGGRGDGGGAGERGPSHLHCKLGWTPPSPILARVPGSESVKGSSEGGKGMKEGRGGGRG